MVFFIKRFSKYQLFSKKSNFMMVTRVCKLFNKIINFYDAEYDTTFASSFYLLKLLAIN